MVSIFVVFLLLILINQGRKIMTALDNLNTNILNLTTTINSVKSYIDTLKSTTGESEAAVQLSADAVAAANTALVAVLPTA